MGNVLVVKLLIPVNGAKKFGQRDQYKPDLASRLGKLFSQFLDNREIFSK